MTACHTNRVDAIRRIHLRSATASHEVGQRPSLVLVPSLIPIRVWGRTFATAFEFYGQVPVVQLHAFRGDSSFPILICFGKRWSLVWEQGGRWGEFGVSHGQLFMSAYNEPCKISNYFWFLSALLLYISISFSYLIFERLNWAAGARCPSGKISGHSSRGFAGQQQGNAQVRYACSGPIPQAPCRPLQMPLRVRD